MPRASVRPATGTRDRQLICVLAGDRDDRVDGPAWFRTARAQRLAKASRIALRRPCVVLPVTVSSLQRLVVFSHSAPVTLSNSR